VTLLAIRVARPPQSVCSAIAAMSVSGGVRDVLDSEREMAVGEAGNVAQ
jgi:hypothetical protein